MSIILSNLSNLKWFNNKMIFFMYVVINKYSLYNEIIL